jgi:hypothetical protein
MHKIERELGRASSGNLSRLGQLMVYRNLSDLRWRKPSLFIILSFEQLFKLRYKRVGGSSFSSGKDSTFSKSSLTKKYFKDLNPHSCLEAISFGQLVIVRLSKLQDKPPSGNESKFGQSTNHRE